MKFVLHFFEIVQLIPWILQKIIAPDTRKFMLRKSIS